LQPFSETTGMKLNNNFNFDSLNKKEFYKELEIKNINLNEKIPNIQYNLINHNKNPSLSLNKKEENKNKLKIEFLNCLNTGLDNHAIVDDYNYKANINKEGPKNLALLQAKKNKDNSLNVKNFQFSNKEIRKNGLEFIDNRKNKYFDKISEKEWNDGFSSDKDLIEVQTTKKLKDKNTFKINNDDNLSTCMKIQKEYQKFSSDIFYYGKPNLPNRLSNDVKNNSKNQIFKFF